MPLEMKQQCQTCETATPNNTVAYICSYECTFCSSCTPTDMRCPNCDGELQPRPRRGVLRGAPSMTVKRLRAFDDAWGRGDIAALADFISDDCVYSASLGAEPGTTYVGKSEVMRGFAELIEYETALSDGAPRPQTAPPENLLWLHGDRAFSHWSYPDRDANGGARWVRGFDLFEFDGRLIRRKDAFIKAERKE